MTLTAVPTSAPAQSAVVDRCAVVVPNAAADRSAVLAQSVAADRCVEIRHVAPVQIVVTLDGVRAVAQKDGDRSVQADLRVEVDRSVVIPSGVRCVVRSVVTRSGVRCAARSVVIRSGVQCAAQSVVIRGGVRCVAQSVVTPSGVRCVGYSAVIPNAVQSVARMDFHFLSHRPHALGHSRVEDCVAQVE